jgi:hypothetical protein
VQLLALRQIAELAAFVLDQQVMEAVGADDQAGSAPDRVSRAARMDKRGDSRASTNRTWRSQPRGSAR